MDYVNAMFVGMTIVFSVVPILLRSVDQSLIPGPVIRLYAYGKITGGTRPSGVLNVPKRWYAHFYVLAAALSVAAALVLLDVYCPAASPWPAGSAWCRRWLWRTDSARPPSYSPAATCTAVAMAVLQFFRRLYETYRVNVFSDTAIGIGHYVGGYAHYAGVIATIMAEAPLSASAEPFCRGPADAVRLIVAALTFAWAYREQWRANITLAAARKRDGRVVTYEHRVITGGLFDLVSSPQMFSEVIMYSAWYVALWGSEGWKYVLLFVWANQVTIAVVNHQWYRNKFPDYPRHRKAIIPYLL